MNPQLTKELRPLLLPWLVAAVAGLTQALSSEFLFGISGFVFFSTAVVLVAMTFGTEFQHRTLWLVLTQPSDRAKIWDKKLLAVAIALGTLALLDCRFQRALHETILLPWFFTTATIALIVCAAGFWIGKGHSLMAATALSLVTNLPLLAATIFAAMVWFSPGTNILNALVVAFLIYPFAYILVGWSFWRDKLPLLALGTLAILLLSSLGSFGANSTNADRGGLPIVLLTCTFFVATACSGGFWTLTAKSTIGGAAFTFAAQFALAVTVVTMAHKTFDFPTDFTDLRVALAVAAFGMLYSGVFLWLGRGTWRTLELRENVMSESAAMPEIPVRGFGFLQCQPRSLMLNLFRKELRLQRSLMLLAALFAGCWLLAVVATIWAPGFKLESLLQALFLFYAPLYLLMAGCISLSDEMALGTMPWHLTFPTNPLRLWAAKFLTGGAVGLLLGIAFPLMLAWLTQVVTPVNLRFFDDQSALALIAVFACVFYLMSFWSATMVSGTVRAALTSLALTAGFTALYVWGWNLGKELDLLGPTLPAAVFAFLQTAVLPRMLDDVWLLTIIGAFPLVLFIIWQSSVEFRRPQPKPRAFWKRAIVTAILTLLVPFLVGGAVNSAKQAFRQMEGEVQQAAKIVLEKGRTMTVEQTREITLADLQRTGMLSPTVEKWLRGCTIECNREPEPKSEQAGNGARFGLWGKPYVLDVSFPSRAGFSSIVYAQPHSGQ